MHHTSLPYQDFSSIFQALQLTNVASYSLFGNLFDIFTKCYLYFCKLGPNDTFQNFQEKLGKYLQACSLPCCCGYFSYKLQLYQLVLGILKFSIFNAFIEDFVDKKGSNNSIIFNTLTGISFSGKHFFRSKFFLLSLYVLCTYFRKKTHQFLQPSSFNN